MDATDRSRVDELLDLLADTVAERIQARSALSRVEPEPVKDAPLIPPGFSEPGPILVPTAQGAPVPALTPIPEPILRQVSEPVLEPEPAPDPIFDMPHKPTSEFEQELESLQLPPTPLATHAAALMSRLALSLFVVVVLINIPFNAHGTAIARSIPSSASLVIRNGLLVKEKTKPEVWVYRDGAFHWITSLEAFTQWGYRWRDVHVVDAGYLDRFVKGKPLYLLLRCRTSPHYYRIEEGHKRWIVDIPTFTAEGYSWQDIKVVPCSYLRDLPVGDSIPPGRGSPPPPLP